MFDPLHMRFRLRCKFMGYVDPFHSSGSAHLQKRAHGHYHAALLLLQSATLARARGFDDRRQDHEPATLETDTDALGSVPQRFPS